MTPQEIFNGIPTAELISYKILGDNSKELQQEIDRRISTEHRVNRVGANNVEIEAKYNGIKCRI